MNSKRLERLERLEAGFRESGLLEPSVPFSLTPEEAAKCLRDGAVCARDKMIIPQLWPSVRGWQQAVGTDDEPEARQRMVEALVAAVREWLACRSGQQSTCNAGEAVNAVRCGRPMPALEACPRCEVVHDDASIQEAVSQMGYFLCVAPPGPVDVAYLDHWRQVAAAVCPGTEAA
jgi:hypothetical protein